MDSIDSSLQICKLVSYLADRLQGKVQLVQMLLEEGAALDKYDDFGRTPLMIACMGDEIKDGRPEYGNLE